LAGLENSNDPGAVDHVGQEGSAAEERICEVGGLGSKRLDER
jgi:hypothetical protein